MPCKHCGLVWRKDVSAKELHDEVARRKSEARVAEEKFLNEHWPKMRRHRMLALFVPLFICVLSLVILAVLLGANIATPSPLTVVSLGMMVALLASFVGTWIFDKHREMLRKEFAEEFPEHAGILYPDLFE